MEIKYYYVKDVMKMLNCSSSLAYKIIRRINDELKEEGYIVIAGRVPKKRFEERMCVK